MSTPRPVFPGCILVINRRCTQRQFLLRPDDETSENFAYCLGEAIQRFEMGLILSQMEPNHHHTVVFDPHGRQTEFREHLHKMVAKSQNALRGRWENLWSSEEPCVIEVLTTEDLLDWLVYTATNPVKDNLVEKVHHWPGPKFVQALLTGRPMTVRRPKHFFSEHGTMPAQVELVLKLPDEFEGKDEFLAELRRRIAEVELNCARERQLTGRRVLGRRRVLLQSWRDSPTSREPRRNRRPRVSSRNPLLRIMKLRLNAEWQLAYRQARRDWLSGIPTEFPYGTYWLKRFANVRVKPPPQFN
jgi:putative transposase